ncbi:hypothetical protein QRX50_19350 [Amycolatopsis carbonis]|uniref:Uncharacterized protein n=1 Tax=Amycolatopsis carbonis TaxID=715471 RepID=A0A9Y2N2Q4_9PSEU|nr:hypothetical protein [Amycolatopsis sp. 2-15]WIX84267.1 hypothetical protein QRX50_19350 [Amycolatopsis sp. 2-15]
MQVLADAGDVLGVDPHLPQVRGRADAAAQQDRRGTDGAAFDHNAVDQRRGGHGQRRVVQHRRDEALPCAHAAPVAHGDLVEADSAQLVAVEVVVARVARRQRRLDEGCAVGCGVPIGLTGSGNGSS